MLQDARQQPVFRFAPSPNGRLHLGHALSAMLNHDSARAIGGTYLVRIEDIDPTRCTPALEAEMLEDLAWLDLSSDQPERRQSGHVQDYVTALERLETLGVTYPAFLSRGEVKTIVGRAEQAGTVWPRDPEGVPLFPDIDRKRTARERSALLSGSKRHQIRLDTLKALELVGRPLVWMECGSGTEQAVTADPSSWGDIVLSRSDAPSSYALSVVVDDAVQAVTHVVRGMDLFHATSIQRLLQALLDIAPPVYRHHRLILDAEGRKLSKSSNSTALATLRQAGAMPSDIRRLVGF